MSTPTLLSMTAPLREDFDIPYHDLAADAGPPRLALVAGLHGNELNGIFVLSRLASFLQRVVDGRQPGIELRHRVIIVPAVNVLGVNTHSRRWPFDSTDINRMFPGYNAGETTQRIAHAVLEVTRAAHYRVDVHSSNLEFEELPQVRLYEPSDEERSTARRFGLPAVIERPTSAVLSSTIGHAWRATDGENFVIQAGQAGVIQPLHCDRLFRGLVEFLRRSGIVHGIEFAHEEHEVHYFDAGHTFPLISEHAGFFVSRLEVGRWLQAGDRIGQVYDPFDGTLRVEIKTPVAGLLSGLRRQPLLCEGDLIARVQTRHALDTAAAPPLSSQGQ